MQEIKKNSVIPEPSRFSWFASLVLLVLICSSIVGLYIYQYFRAYTIEELRTDIAQLEMSIHIASTDRDVIIANILNSTTIRPPLPIRDIVDSFRLLATQEGVRLQWFSVRDDILSTTLIAKSDMIGVDPVETIITMMRGSTPDTGLQLDPIHALAGTTSERTTGVTFHILPSKSTTNVNK